MKTYPVLGNAPSKTASLEAAREYSKPPAKATRVPRDAAIDTCQLSVD